MYLSEIFNSIQGEGKNAGTPAIFIRFSGCNLKCPDCDTKYHTEGKEYSIAQVLDYCNKHKEKIHRIVFTGGEPLLFQEDIKQIIIGLKPFGGRNYSYKNWSFEIETNGTLSPDTLDSEFSNKWSSINIDYNVSPKLTFFNNQNKRDYSVLSKLSLFHNSTFKFVISRPEDLDEINEIKEKAGIADERIYIMPRGYTEEDVKKNSRIAVDLCLKSGYKYSPRLHIMIWGNKKGI